ncbi:MAG: M56 family metallopeptidase [Allomuricauda sp.]
MEVFAIYLLKTSGLIVLFWLFYQTLLKKETFFIINRWFLLAGLALSLCTPLFYFTQTVWIDPVVISYPEVSTVNHVSNSLTSETSWDWSLFVFAIYLIGVMFLTIRFIVQLYSLRKLINKNDSVKIGKFHLLESKEKVTPFSFFKHIIYNPTLYSQHELLTIIEHEKVHVRQLHSIDVLLAHVLLIFQWFNPFMWRYKMAIQQNLEFIADQDVTSLQSSKKDYQYLLLKTGTNTPQYTFTNPFFDSTIKKRIMMLNSKPSKRTSFYKYSLILPFLIGFIFMFNIKTEAKIRPSQESTTASEVISEKSKPRLYTITQNTSERELEQTINQVRKDGGELHIQEIQRNDNNLIIKLVIRYDAKQAGITTGNATNENGISDVNFGISEEGGAFIRINPGIIPDSTQGQSQINTISYERVPNNPSNQNNSTLVLHKNTTDDEIKILKQSIETLYGGTFTYKDVKRNNLGEIVRLEMSYDNQDQGGSSWRFDKNEPVPNTFFKRNEKGGLHIDIVNAPAGIQSGNVKQTQRGESGNVSISIYESIDSTLVTKQKDIDASEHVKSNIVVGQQPLFGHMRSIMRNNQNSLKEPIYLLDGKEINYFDLTKLKPDDIASINIFKDQNAKYLYGKRAENGVVSISSKHGAALKLGDQVDNQAQHEKKKVDVSGLPKNALVVINGKKSNRKELENLSPYNIESITVTKDSKEMISKYGRKAKKGVIEIITKKKN